MVTHDALVSTTDALVILCRRDSYINIVDPTMSETMKLDLRCLPFSEPFLFAGKCSSFLEQLRLLRVDEQSVRTNKLIAEVVKPATSSVGHEAGSNSFRNQKRGLKIKYKKKKSGKKSFGKSFKKPNNSNNSKQFKKQ